MTHPLVSIIIPCYNYGRYLAEAIDSVLEQTYDHTEIVLIDDGSTDMTPEVAMAYGDRIRYIRQQNAGPAVARNTGLQAARGELILNLDADDYLRPEVLERYVGVAVRKPDASVLLGSWQEVDVEGRSLTPVRQQSVPEDLFHALLVGNPYHVHCAMIRRSAFDQVGPWDASLPPSEDWDLFLRLAAAGCIFVTVPGAISLYRRHPMSLCTKYELLWRTGRSLLRKSRNHHPGCRLCRCRIAQAHSKLRQGCFGILKHDLGRCLNENGMGCATAKLIRETLRNPDLAWLFLAEPLRPLGRAARSAQRKLVASIVLPV